MTRNLSTSQKPRNAFISFFRHTSVSPHRKADLATDGAGKGRSSTKGMDESLRIAGVYSFNKGQQVVQNKYPDLLKEVKKAISNVDASAHKIKQSKEKTMPGQMLYSPVSLNKAFKKQLYPIGWKSIRVPCTYATEFYSKDYTPKALRKGAFREMDFVKRKLGVEVQFGKYSFMVYNVAAKMTFSATWATSTRASKSCQLRLWQMK